VGFPPRWLWAGGWRRGLDLGAGARWGLWAAGVAGDTQERRPPRREQREIPDGTLLHGAGLLKAVAVGQLLTSPGSRVPKLTARFLSPVSLRACLGPWDLALWSPSHGAVQPLPSPPPAPTSADRAERCPGLGR
jgi:hypothetical protein